MTIGELAAVLHPEIVVPGDETREVTEGYCGDLLSWVMGRAPAGCVWITVMGNVNAIAVAVLADVSVLLLAEDSPLDEEALTKARQQNITVWRSPQAAYPLAVAIHEHMQNNG